MRLIILVIAVLIGLGVCGSWLVGWWTKKTESPKLVSAPAEMQVAVMHQDKIVGSVADSVTSVGSYRFIKRLVPDPPQFLKDDNKSGMIVQSEAASNSWVWIGSPVLGSQIRDLARAYDVVQIEMDLEFVLILVATDRLKSRGLSIFYSERASWLDALSLTGDAGSLRISSGGWAAQLDYSDSQTGLAIMSQPCIRVLDGQEWGFANDAEVPVPRSEVVDGVIRQSVEFRPAGFGLKGLVRVVGDDILLTVDQRNGSIAPTTGEDSQFPSFLNQTLQTTVRLAWWEWSVLGGIQIDKEQTRKGIFKRSTQESSDYLVIFVRPRLGLEAPEKAIPVGSSRESHPLLPDRLDLPWLDD